MASIAQKYPDTSISSIIWTPGTDTPPSGTLLAYLVIPEATLTLIKSQAGAINLHQYNERIRSFFPQLQTVFDIDPRVRKVIGQ